MMDFFDLWFTIIYAMVLAPESGNEASCPSCLSGKEQLYNNGFVFLRMSLLITFFIQVSHLKVELLIKTFKKSIFKEFYRECCLSLW